MLPARAPATCAMSWIAWVKGSARCNSSSPWSKIPPPTQSMAAVPIADKATSSLGTMCTSAPPNARALLERRSAMCRPMSSSFTISATTP